MNQPVALPTQRDEDWRYADFAAVGQMAPASIGAWQSVVVGPGESWCRCLVAGGTSPEVQRLRIDVAEGASAELFVANVGAAFTRVEAHVTLARGAHLELGGVTIGGDAVTREIVTRVTHADPQATSRQVVRAVHWGRATGNFLGRIEVARNAQGTDAVQDFKALLLERGATANAKPELEIFADDVKCAHGAAIGQIDERARFYMAARGLPPEIADQLLVRAFIADAFTALADADEQDRLLAAALAVLEART